MFQESFEGVSRKIEVCFNKVLSRFQGCLKELNGEKFQGCFNFDGVKRKMEGVSLRPSRELQGYLRKFQGCSKKVCFKKI